ncbi:hypothetical protein X975_03497, partial [Stegodyphus mimosarum]
MCEICNKSFRCKYKLKSHMIIHALENHHRFVIIHLLKILI